MGSVCDWNKSLRFWKSSHKPDSVTIPWSLVSNEYKTLRRQSHPPLIPLIIPAGVPPGLTFTLLLLCSQLSPCGFTAGHTPSSKSLSSLSSLNSKCGAHGLGEHLVKFRHHPETMCGCQQPSLVFTVLLLEYICMRECITHFWADRKKWREGGKLTFT